MPTNKERREVADGLRRQVKRLGPQMDAHEFAHYGADVIDSDNEILRWDQMMLRLADLIKPEPERTCHDVSFDPLREFVCSWCGCHIDVLGIESEPTMWLGGSPIEPSFCPNCGAKVVANE